MGKKKKIGKNFHFFLYIYQRFTSLAGNKYIVSEEEGAMLSTLVRFHWSKWSVLLHLSPPLAAAIHVAEKFVEKVLHHRKASQQVESEMKEYSTKVPFVHSRVKGRVKIIGVENSKLKINSNSNANNSNKF